MEWLLENEAVREAIAQVVTVLVGALVAIATLLAGYCVGLVREWVAAANEQRRRAFADDVVAAVEQMHPALAGAAKLKQAQALAETLGGELMREDIEAAVYRLHGQGWVEPLRAVGE
jgi:hypothetical protein